MSDIDPDLIPPDRGATRLIERSDTLERLNAQRVTDARTAMARGLKEYMEQLRIIFGGGRELRFLRVHEEWSDPEDEAVYPSAVVDALGPGTYDEDKFTPRLIKLEEDAVHALRKTTELSQEYQVTIYATDKVERRGLVAMLEDAFCPVEFMYGFRLDLPHYHNARATFAMGDIDYIDDEESVQARLRIAQITVQGVIPVYRVIGRPPMLDVRLEVGTTEVDDEC